MRAHEFVTEHRLVWRRNPRTGQISMRWRCESGPKKGRTMPSAAGCQTAPDVARRETMKRTRARTKVRQARRAKRTKRINPRHKLLSILNKFR
jgi:hypothetical protein